MLGKVVVLVLLLSWAIFCPSIDQERRSVVEIIKHHIEYIKGQI
jgi:hypothetical protein